MRKVFIFIFMLVFISYTSSAFCAKSPKKMYKAAEYIKRSKKMEGIKDQITLLRYEIDALQKGSNKDNLYRLNKWIRKLETKVISKKQRAEVRVEKYKHNTNATSEISREVDINVEKIRSSEIKIQICQDLLNVLDQLKGQLNKQKY